MRQSSYVNFHRANREKQFGINLNMINMTHLKANLHYAISHAALVVPAQHMILKPK